MGGTPEADGTTCVVIAVARPDGTRLLVAGDIDPDGEERLRSRLDDAVGPGARVTVDLSRAGRLPHAVLQALAVTHRRLADGGGRLVLEAPSVHAMRALRTSGLHRILDIRPAPASTRAGDLAAGA